MAALIAGSAIRTCLGSGADTFAGLLSGVSGVGVLRHGDPAKLNVAAGHHVRGAGSDDPSRPFRASGLLAECLTEAVRQSGVDFRNQRIGAVVGTGLRELSAVERWARTGAEFPVRRLDFDEVVREVLPDLTEVITVSNACSAGGHALALAQDLVELGEVDAVVVGAADTMTESMLAMIGKVTEGPTAAVRPFDRNRSGVLLGDGAAALVVVPDSWRGPALARLAGTGLSCDAFHPTAPDIEGIGRAMTDAFGRSGLDPSVVDLVVAHGTATVLNDPVECDALRKVVLGAGGDPLVTAVKGSLGHTSGAAALVNVDVALRGFASGLVPPVTGLVDPLPEGAGLRFVIGDPVPAWPRVAQINAFGFGGVNAVTLLESL